MPRLSKKSFLISLTILAGTMLLANLVFAWTTPTADPPAGNLPAPINEGNTTQTKSGGLNISGNVGIGTTGPSYKLDVAGTGRFASTTNPGLVIGDGSTGYLKVGSTGWYDDGSYFSPLGARSFYIRSNVPTSSIYSDNIYLGAASGDNIHLRDNQLYGDDWIINYNATGSFGIGTTSPSQQLELTKNMEIPDTTHANQYGIIYKNGTPFIHNFNYGDNGATTTVGYNIFIGENAGNFTMGSGATWTNDASYNTAIGYAALHSNTIGRSNTAVGDHALYSDTNGYSNVANGEHALYSNTTGDLNTAVGSYALYSNTTGDANTAIGVDAGRYINGTGLDNASSTDSVYLGYYTQSKRSGSDNEIVIGYWAEGAGSNSVVLGNDNIVKTLLKGNVGIGTTAPTISLAVGDTDTGLNSAGDGKLDIYSNNVNTMSIRSGNVGIGTTTPAYKLDVSGIINATDIYKNGSPLSSGYWTKTDNDIYYNDGNVGIGTTTPGYLLDAQGGKVNASDGFCINGDCKTSWSQIGGVQGSGNANYIPIWVDSGTLGTSTIYEDSSGNVGIGTTAPGAKLEVTGNIKLSGTSPTYTITNLAAPVNDTDVATKKYVDEQCKYCDEDGDGHYAMVGAFTCLSGRYSFSQGDDCDDSCATCYPGSSHYTTDPDGKDQDCDGEIDNPLGTSILVYVSTSTYNGDLGGRSGADAKCDLGSTLNCASGKNRAFLTVSDSDEIRDMPTNYGYHTSLPIYWYNRSTTTLTLLANDWADMLDGSIQSSEQDGTGSPDYSMSWEGSLEDGSLCGNTCEGWTTSADNGPSGCCGRSEYTTKSWLYAASAQCNSAEHLRCICEGTPSGYQ